MSEFAFIDHVLEKFVKEEIEIELKLRNLQDKYEKYDLVNIDGNAIMGNRSHFHASREAALKRNKSFLKDLEVQAAKLRSRTYFCPTDLQLTTLKNKYYETLASQTKPNI